MDEIYHVELALVVVHDIYSLVSQATCAQTSKWYILDALESRHVPTETGIQGSETF